MICLANSNYTKMRGLIEVQAAAVVAKMTRSMPVWTEVEFAEAASKGLPFYWQFAPSQDPYPRIEPRSTMPQEIEKLKYTKHLRRSRIQLLLKFPRSLLPQSSCVYK